MIAFKAGLHWVWLRLCAWNRSPYAVMHISLFMVLAAVVYSLWAWNIAMLDTIPVWLLAAYLSLRLAQEQEDKKDLSDIVEIQTAILKVLIPGRYTEGESEHVDLGPGTSPPGSVPSS